MTNLSQDEQTLAGTHPLLHYKELYRFPYGSRWYKMRFWDPIIGCAVVSKGCANCSSAYTVSRNGYAPGTVNGTRFNGVIEYRPSALRQRFKSGEQIFVAGRSDLFHERVTDEYRQRIYEVASNHPSCTFLALTKRPHLIPDGTNPPKNFWIGISVDDQRTADERLPYFDRFTGTKVVSAKPLLGPLDLGGFEPDMVCLGGEHGPGSRVMLPPWAMNLRDQCVNRDIPFSFHNWGSWRPGPGLIQREVNGHTMHWRQKDEGGTLLEGETWDQYPLC